MQGLADGYFVIPYTIGDYLANLGWSDRISTDHPAFKEALENVQSRIQKLLSIKGHKTVDQLHRELGLTMWDYCGMSRTAEGLQRAKVRIQELRNEFWENVNILGSANELNQELEKAGRVADFMELGELMVDDALHRSESCGGHFREESQTPDGEALRKDDEFSYVAAWEFTGDSKPETLHKEELLFENVKLTQRSYK
jgi:succinate dehydrogenase / fumarate reductase flavoprotein subunit